MDMIHARKELIQTKSHKDCLALSEKVKLQALEFEFYCMNSSSNEVLKKSLYQMISLCQNTLDELDKQQQLDYKQALNQRKDQLVSKLLEKK